MSKAIIDELEECLEHYFQIFIECYPDSHTVRDRGVFGPDELYQLSIKAHCLRAMLGSDCVNRLEYIGFDEYISFDNPIDWYNWAAFTRENKIPREKYLAIGIRIDSELKRLRFFAERESLEQYGNLSYGPYMIPAIISEPQNKTASDSSVKLDSDSEKNREQHGVFIGNIHVNYSAEHEKEAIDNLDKLHKKSSIVTSWLSLLTKPFGL